MLYTLSQIILDIIFVYVHDDLQYIFPYSYDLLAAMYILRLHWLLSPACICSWWPAIYIPIFIWPAGCYVYSEITLAIISSLYIFMMTCSIYSHILWSCHNAFNRTKTKHTCKTSRPKYFLFIYVQPEPCFNIKTVFPGMGIFIINIRWSWDHLTLITGISYNVKIASSYWDSLWCCYNTVQYNTILKVALQWLR